MEKKKTVIAYVFPKLETAKDLVRQIYRKSRFRRPIKKRHGKHSKTLLKSEERHLYIIYWSLWRQWTLKNSPLVIFKILGLFVNTLNADNKDSLLNRDNLTQPIQMKLFEKQNFFFFFFHPFLNLDYVSNILKKRWPSELMYFSSCRLWKISWHKCLKSLVSRDTSTSDMVNGPKDGSTLKTSTFTIFIDHSEGNWVE